MRSRVPLRGLHRSRAGAGDSPAAVTHAAPREFSPAASPLTSLHVSRASVLVCEVHTALGCFLGWEGTAEKEGDSRYHGCHQADGLEPRGRSDSLPVAYLISVRDFPP